MELEVVLKEKYSKKYVDVEDLYQRKIKNVYGDIIDFSAKAQANMTPEYVDELYNLKLANRYLVEAIKNTKHLQKNIVKYSSNPNKHIQKEYANVRLSLAGLLRNVNIIATTDEEDVILLLLSKIRLHAKKHDIVSNGVLDNLIRQKLISNQMATSLMNDSVYAYNISNRLANMAEVLFIKKGGDLNKLNEDLGISQGEIDEILEKKD